jgi:hypothetical protein
MKFTFKVKKKTLESFNFNERLDEIFVTKEKITLPEDYNIITAANWRHFHGLQFLLYSLNRWYDVDIYVYDVGLTEKQIKWCSQLTKVHISDRFHSPFPDLPYWEAWVKPYYIKNSPFQKNLWIDCDTVVTGNLNLIFEAYNFDKPLFTTDHSGINEGILNHENLYLHMPIKGVTKDTVPYLNTGVYIIDTKRDEDLIDEWLHCVNKAAYDSKIRESILCWDQGACKWALQKTKMLNCITDRKAFNYPAVNRQIIHPLSHTAYTFFLNSIHDAIRDGIIINHWMGSPKPWAAWISKNEVLPIFKNEDIKI